ncbi:MAG: Protein translocase subunit SecE [Fimbriimonadaceae bacterium]|nr:Protein translocase subunit SecE [Fimbriimonadaceae bacterium]
MSTAMEEREPVAAPTSIPIPKVRRGLRQYFRDVSQEMKKVTWPTRTETNRLTGVVLGVCILVVLFLTALSVVFDTIFQVVFRGGLK